MESTADWTERAIVVLVVIAVVTTGSGQAIAASGVASERSPARADLGPQVDADDVLLRVHLQPDGSAAWQIEYRIRLDDANETEAFEELQSDIEANESAYVSRFASRIRDTVSNAENRTGREMAAENFSVHTERRQIPQEYGVVTYSFDWQGFARTDGTTVRAGDALAGLFLDAETTLLVAWPDGFALSTVAPTPDETRPQAVVWEGPTDFSSGEPTVVVASATTTATGTTNPGTKTDPGTTASPTKTGERSTTAVGNASDGGGFPAALLGVVLLALVAAGGVIAVRRRGAGATGPPADDELMTNDERVLELLEANDGRVKQQAVVEELGWTEAKTSRVVNELQDEGRIEVFRLGRENVLSLPEDDT